MTAQELAKYPHYAWVDEHPNYLDEGDALLAAQIVADDERRTVEVGVDNHGGYPRHYYVLGQSERHRSFGFHVALVAPSV